MAQSKQSKKVVSILLVGSDGTQELPVVPLELGLEERIRREVKRVGVLARREKDKTVSNKKTFKMSSSGFQAVDMFVSCQCLSTEKRNKKKTFSAQSKRIRKEKAKERKMFWSCSPSCLHAV